jgi:hypothetical protein
MAKSPSPKLSVITAQSAADQLAPPEHLGAAAAQLWRDVTSNYAFDDPASLRILAEACSALDRAERCREQITTDGEAVRSGEAGCSGRTRCLRPKSRAGRWRVACCSGWGSILSLCAAA